MFSKISRLYCPRQELNLRHCYSGTSSVTQPRWNYYSCRGQTVDCSIYLFVGKCMLKLGKIQKRFLHSLTWSNYVLVRDIQIYIHYTRRLHLRLLILPQVKKINKTLMKYIKHIQNRLKRGFLLGISDQTHARYSSYLDTFPCCLTQKDKFENGSQACQLFKKCTGQRKNIDFARIDKHIKMVVCKVSVWPELTK